MINAEMFHFFLSASLFPWAGITFLDSDRELSSQGTPTLRPQSLTINPIPPPTFWSICPNCVKSVTHSRIQPLAMSRWIAVTALTPYTAALGLSRHDCSDELCQFGWTRSCHFFSDLGRRKLTRDFRSETRSDQAFCFPIQSPP
jgi:hypothetical protein